MPGTSPTGTAHTATMQAAIITTNAKPGTEPLSWEEISGAFGAEQSYWVATTGPGGGPQIRPVFAVWLDGRAYSTTSPAAAKGRNLDVRPEVSLAARAPACDITVEGPASWVTGRDLLGRLVAAYNDKYGWPVTLRDDGLFDAPYGAPTAGNPPYRPYEITPARVYAFPTTDGLYGRATRFTLAAGTARSR